jgi:hypothetical protein
MVSTKTRRVAGVIAAATWRASVASTRLTSTPIACSVCKRLLVLPNRNWLLTMWSPAFSSATSTAAMAAMPVEKQAVPRACSSRLSLVSSAAPVGLPWRA